VRGTAEPAAHTVRPTGPGAASACDADLCARTRAFREAIRRTRLGARAGLEELARERRAARQAAVESAIGRAGGPPRFRHHGFDDYVASGEAQLRALTLAREFAANFAAIRERGNCLLLVGGPGTGKTHLACAILAQVIHAGHSGLFLTLSEGLRLIRSTYSPGAVRSEAQVFATLNSPDQLVLDEVGAGIGNDAKRRAMLFDVLNARYGEMRPTILIGNLTAAEMEEYLGERIMGHTGGGDTLTSNAPKLSGAGEQSYGLERAIG
jgi:DNA replication protein DnaC